MTTISIRLPNNPLKEADKRARELHIPRAEYIRRAIETLNAKVTSQQRRDRIIKASQRVRAESMRVIAEFSAIEDAPDA